MALYDPNSKPQLRYVEARPVESGDQVLFALSDPSGLAGASFTVNEAALLLLALLDGQRTLSEVRDDFARETGGALEPETLAEVLTGLSKAHLLAGDEFEAYYTSLVEGYRAAPARPMGSAADLGLDHQAGEVLRTVIQSSPVPPVSGRIVGLIAPHLDYPRGTPCYSAAYSTLLNRPPPRRVVILGTNHFGRASAVVVTSKDFATPLGTTCADREFIAGLETRCGDLRRHEFDHLREHSVELQLLFCQHLWGATAFQFVPVLCPDPCGPTGTAPLGGEGVDLGDFAAILRDCIRDDPEDTLVIAGADLSHVGAYFGDDGTLDDDFLRAVEHRDRSVLDCLARNDPDAFLHCVKVDGNPSRICSVGCIFVAMHVLRHAKATVLRYHQAVDVSVQNAVTCAAAVFTE